MSWQLGRSTSGCASREAAAGARALDRGGAGADGAGGGARLPAAARALAPRPSRGGPPLPALRPRRRRGGGCSSGCTAAPTASARRGTHAPLVGALARAGRDRGGAARLPARARAPVPRRGRGRARRLGGAARRGLAPGPDRARRRQRRRRARLRAAAPAARGRRRAARLRRRVQPLDRPHALGREPRGASRGATPCCRRSGWRRCATRISPAPTRATRAPRRTSGGSRARRRC